jgi:hypothetical protein
VSTPSEKIVRVAAVAFALQALLLLVDVFGFGAAFSNGHDSDRFWPVVRIVVVALLAGSLLQRATTPWLVGVIACVAFLIRDLMRMREIFAGPPLEAPQRLLTSAILMSLIAGIGASWWASASTVVRRRAV